jgi:hypothetical protein
MAPSPRAFLESLYRTAVAAAHPSSFSAHWPEPSTGKLIILAAGKAAGSMTEAAEQHYLDALKMPANRLTGVAVARHGYGRPTRVVKMIEAGHPIPDAAGLEAAVYRRLVEHLRERADVQNIDMMNLAGFCRNCLSNWMKDAADAKGIAMTKDESREIVYGEPFEQWKAKHQKEASKEQKAAFEKSSPRH